MAKGKKRKTHAMEWGMNYGCSYFVSKCGILVRTFKGPSKRPTCLRCQRILKARAKKRTTARNGRK